MRFYTAGPAGGTGILFLSEYQLFNVIIIEIGRREPDDEFAQILEEDRFKA